jgi:hypothetical protein
MEWREVKNKSNLGETKKRRKKVCLKTRLKMENKNVTYLVD